MDKISIHHIPVEQLKGAEYNPRKWDQTQVDQLKESITRFGLVDPIIVNANPARQGIVIGGHFRLFVAKELGYTEVPVVFVDIEDVQKEMELNIRLNKNSGSWDFNLLANFDEKMLLDVGFSTADIDLAFGLNMGDDAKKTDEDGITPENAPTRATVGDVWLLGPHRLLVDDGTKLENMDRLMNGKAADMIFTDPPYNVDYEGKTKDALKIQNDKFGSSDDFYQFLLDAYTSMAYAAKNGAGIYVCHADSEGLNFRKAMIDAGFLLKQCIIWNKNSMVMGRQDYHWKHEPILYGWKDGAAHNWYGPRDQTTVWDIPRPSKSEEHPTMKPIELVLKALLNSSERENIILDLFLGSGTTLLAADQSGRVCYGTEIDPRFADVIIARWEKQTGLTATKEE